MQLNVGLVAEGRIEVLIELIWSLELLVSGYCLVIARVFLPNCPFPGMATAPLAGEQSMIKEDSTGCLGGQPVANRVMPTQVTTFLS